MKKFLPVYRMLSVILFLAFSMHPVYSQPLLIENFDYTDGSLLTSNGWVAHSGSGTQPVDVIVPGLTFTGYPLSGIGGAARVDNTGEDVHKTFPSQSAGTIYVAFMVKVDAMAAGYFLHLGQTIISTTFFGRVSIAAGTGSNYKFGLAKSTETAVNTTSEYSIGTTYLAVLKYDIKDGSSNDEVALFIFDGTIPTTEPATATIPVIAVSSTDYSPGSIAMRQYSSSQNIIVDGIRIGKTWDEAVTAALAGDVTPPVPTFLPAQGAVDVAINAKPTITFDEAVRKTDGSELTDADLAGLIVFKKTSNSGDDVAFTATIDATKKIITVTPSAPLANSEQYFLTVGAVEDAAGNEAAAAGISFTTIAAATPTITITAPVGGETFHAGDATSITWTSANITNVRIEVYAPGETVYEWIPFVASTPAAPGSVAITVPADADYGTQYKIRVSDLDNPSVSSESAAFTVIGVATSITDLRARFVANDIVKLSGEATVTFLRPSNRNQKYIQDAGAGLLIDDAAGVLTTTVAVGDNIQGLEGKLGLYGGLLQIVPTVATVTVKSSGNTVTIPELTIPQYKTDYLKYESMLIKLKTVSITEGNGTAVFAESTNYTVTDGTNTVQFRTFKTGDGDLVGKVIPVSKMHMTAIAGFFNTTIQIYSRTLSDFQLLSSAKAITAFSFSALSPAVNGTINEAAKTIALIVPASTNRTALVPTITISEKAIVDPASGAAKDFTNPVIYTVTAEDGSTVTYTVTVSLSTAIEDQPSGRFRIYPVPARTEIYAEGIEDVTLIEIFDVTGNKHITAICDGENVREIPVGKLSRGVYFMRLTTPGGSVMKKFVKE